MHGCGASDMKGGVAVALELVRDLADGDPGPVDVALLLFGREELPPQDNPLPALFAGTPLVHEADLALLLEPTDLTIQAGCVGNLIGARHVPRRQRPLGTALAGRQRRSTAQSRASPRSSGHERREAVVDGLPFYEVVSVTRLEAGTADNVIPDGAVATLNLRYPPDRSPDEAEELVRSLVPADATVEIVGNSPPADVVGRRPARPPPSRARRPPGRAEAGVDERRGLHGSRHPGRQLRPGRDPLRARRDERVEVAALERAYLVLRDLVG